MALGVKAAMSLLLLPAVTAMEHLHNCFKFVWEISNPWDVKFEILADVFDPQKSQNIFVQPTTQGKTIVIKLMGTRFSSTDLVLHPLHALTADQGSWH